MHDGPFEGKQSRAPGSITSTGIKGDRLLSSFVITFVYLIKPCHAENPACATDWFVYHVINEGTVAAQEAGVRSCAATSLVRSVNGATPYD
jgi:hypothetical protein